MFCDQVFITCIAGDGGSGSKSFRREKYVPRGGPDGGDGGRGGHLVLRVNSNLNSLIHLKHQKIYKAEVGLDGGRFNCAGRKGKDLVLEVPAGTLVYNQTTGECIVDLTKNNQETILLEGGRGGFGNAHFKSSIRQAPDFAERGEHGPSMEVRLEMRMVADIGIIGLPSVGKSTLISRITDAKPKIAAYPFTTLIPNMGVVQMSRWGGAKNETFVVADIPGLIEGAHEGKGLGDEFLRHISRTAILVHLLDCQSNDIKNDYKIIHNELKKYDPELVKRPEIVCINKLDTLNEKDQKKTLTKLKKNLSTKEIFGISAVSGEGLKPLIFELKEKIDVLKKTKKNEKKPSSVEDHKTFRPHLENDPHAFIIVQKAPHHYEVKGQRIEQIVEMSDVENPGAVARIYDVMKKMDITQKLRKEGAQMGDVIHIGKGEFGFRG